MSIFFKIKKEKRKKKKEEKEEKEDDMNIDRKNFWKEALPAVRKAIRDADFIAFDMEFSGLDRGAGHRITGADSLQARYRKAVDTVSHFQMLQFGITTFELRKEEAGKKALITRPFNFYTAPRGNMTAQASALEFLSQHKFDFTRCFADGLQYLTKSEEFERRKRNIESVSADGAAEGSGASRTRRKVVIEGEDREFVSDVEYRIEKMRQATSSETSLLLDPCSALRRRLVYQEFSANDLAISKVPQEEGEELAQGHARLRISLTTPEEKMQERLRQMEDDLQQRVGLRHVIDAMVESKKPIVGHNCWLDLAFLYNSFVSRTLPDQLEEYLDNLHAKFPCIADTKYIIQADESVRKELYPGGRGTQLGKAFEKIRAKGPEIIFPDGYGAYEDNLDRAHDAAYDAYMTGVVFAGAASFLEGGLEGLMAGDDPRNMLNRLNMMKFGFPMVLPGPNEEPQRTAFVHLTGFPKWTKTHHVKDNFAQFGDVRRVHWVDDDNLFVQFATMQEASASVAQSASLPNDWVVQAYNDFVTEGSTKRKLGQMPEAESVAKRARKDESADDGSGSGCIVV